MKLTAFMTMYKTKKTPEKQAEFIKEHVKNNYIPYEKKADVAKAIVKASYYQRTKNRGEIEREEFHIDSVAKYMLTCLSMVDLYTDIERSKNEGKSLEEFNTLNGSGVLDLIIQNIDDRELKEFNMVLQMTCDDLMANEYENHAFIRAQVDRFGTLISTALSPILEGLDLDKVKELIEQVK